MCLNQPILRLPALSQTSELATSIQSRTGTHYHIFQQFSTIWQKPNTVQKLTKWTHTFKSELNLKTKNIQHSKHQMDKCITLELCNKEIATHLRHSCESSTTSCNHS